MLKESDPVLTEAEMPNGGHGDNSIELLQACIGQFAERLRRIGHPESAHFLDVAALVLEDEDKKLINYPVRRRSNAGG